MSSAHRGHGADHLIKQQACRRVVLFGGGTNFHMAAADNRYAPGSFMQLQIVDWPRLLSSVQTSAVQADLATVVIS